MSGRIVQNCLDQSSYPFKNVAQNSTSQSISFGGILDEDQYPISSPASNVLFSASLDKAYSGRYVVRFSGSGEFFWNGAACTVISDVDSCVVGATTSNLTVRSNTASQARGYSRVVIQLTTPSSPSGSMSFPASSAKFSNVGGSGVATQSSCSGLVVARCTAPYGDGGITITGDEADVLSGDLTRIFNDDFLNTISLENPGTLRFMGPQAINFSATANIVTRKKPTSIGLFGSKVSPSWWVGTISGSNGLYTCSAPPTPLNGASLTQGETVQGNFSATQPASTTMTAVVTNSTTITCTVADTTLIHDRVVVEIPGVSDVGGGLTTGSGIDWWYTPTIVNAITFTITAYGTFSGSPSGTHKVQYVPSITVGSYPRKAIYAAKFCNPYSDFFNTGVQKVTSGQGGTLYYDALMDAWQLNNAGSDMGPPIEVLVALCNKLQKDLWYCFYVSARTADCVADATYVKNNLSPGLVAHFEYGNELWNSGFDQWHQGITRGAQFGLSFGNNVSWMSYFGYRFAEIMAAIKVAYPAAKAVMAVQGAGDTTVDTSYFKGTSLKSSTIRYWSFNPVDYSVNGNRPIDFADYISYAVYYYGSQTLQFDTEYVGSSSTRLSDLITAADNYATGVPATMDSALQWLDNDIRHGTEAKITGGTIASDGTITRTSHGLSNNDIVQALTFPAQFQANTLYYVVSSATNTFKLSATSGGSAIGSATPGTFEYGRVGQTLLFWATDRLAFWKAYSQTYNKPVILYEGGIAIWHPSNASCTTLGISTGYTQKIINLCYAWKQSQYGLQTIYKQMKDFSADSSSLAACQLQVIGYNPWSLLGGAKVGLSPTDGVSADLAGDIKSEKLALFDGVRLFNNRKRRFLVKT